MDGMKVMRKRLLVIVMTFICSLGFLFACGNPYDGMKINVEVDGSVLSDNDAISLSISSRIEDGVLITNAEEKTVVITVVGKDEVSKEIDIQTDEKISITKEFKDNKNYVKITPRLDGESIITVLTKEGGIKKTIKVNIEKGITSLSVKNMALDVNGKGLDFSPTGDNVLTFVPNDISRKNVLVEFDKDFQVGTNSLSDPSNAGRLKWLTDNFEIVNSVLRVKSGVAKDDILFNSNRITSFGKTCVPIKVTALDTVGKEGIEPVVATKTIEVVDVISDNNIVVYSNNAEGNGVFAVSSCIAISLLASPVFISIFP